MKNLASLFTLLLLWQGILAQDTLTSFALKKAPDENALAFQEGEGVMLMFHERFQFKIQVLDEDLQAVDQYVVRKESPETYETKIRGSLNLAEKLLLFCQKPGSKKYVCLEIDKQAKSLRQTAFPLADQKGWQLLKAFPYQDQFYFIFLQKQSSQLQVYRTSDGEQVAMQRYTLPVENFHSLIQQENRLFIPLIHDEMDNYLPLNFFPFKLYCFGDQLSIGIDDPEAGKMTLYQLRSQSEEVISQTFSYPGFEAAQAAAHQGNSLLYKEHLFLASAYPHDLRLEVFASASGESLWEEAYQDTSQLYQDFYHNVLYRRQFGKVDSLTSLLPLLHQPLSLSVREDENQNLTLSVGVYPKMRESKQGARIVTTLMLNLITVPLAGTVIIPVPEMIGAFQAFSGISGAAYAMAFEQRGDIAHIDATFDISTPALSPKEVRRPPYRRVHAFMLEHEIGAKRYTAPCLFTWQGKTILGYARKKQYWLLDFSTE